MKHSVKRYLFILCSLLLGAVLTGCNTESTSSAETEVTEPTLQDCYLVTNMYGDGQKPWYIVLEYDAEVDASAVSAEDYQVESYDIGAVYTNTDASLPDESISGSYVLVELSTDYTTTNYGGSGSGDSLSFNGGVMDSLNESDGGISEGRSNIAESDLGEIEENSDMDFSDRSGKMGGSIQDGGNGGGRGTFSAQSEPSNQLTVTVQQIGTISFTNGASIEAWEESYTTDYTNNVNLLVENFSQYTFTLSDGTTLMYSLYLPEGYSEDTEYPLVLFMPDATGEGSDEYLALTESLGGVIWTTEEWQSEHAAIVLVPQYESSNTEDPAYTMELVEEIVSHYSVDTAREYLVGQSSGTIRSIKLMIDYPDEFAGGMLVAGQTDSAYTDYISELASQNIWMICSEGDVRAYPGMTEITEAVVAAGIEVTIAQWSAALPDEEQEQLAAEQASAGTSINWTIYDIETVMRDDVSSTDATEHMNTWRVAYDLDTVREWLFEQTK